MNVMLLRTLVLTLILANLVFFAWSHGSLRALGLGPAPQSEPQRLQQQIRPDNLRVLPEGGEAAPAAASSSTPAPQTP